MLYCPSDTKELIDVNKLDKISNFALRYQRFLKGEIHNGKVKFSIHATTLGNSAQAVEPLRDRQTNQLNYLVKSYNCFCEFYKVDWRLVVGLGGEHVQETSITLDHIYGIPYIPGSAFKGAVRSWVLQEKFGNDEKRAIQEIKASDSEDLKQNKLGFRDVFGSQESAGKVLFLAAYPIDSVQLSLDIMNPHFPDYYAGKKLPTDTQDPILPTDTQDPIPINFLTVEPTLFRFVFLAKEQKLIDITKDWAEKALTDKGLGAKTAVGYGYFRKEFPNNIQGYKSLKPDPKFEIPRKEHPERPQKISLEEAKKEFDKDSNNPNLDPQLIDITPVKNCASQLAQVVTRGDYIEYDQLTGIDECLIELEEDLAERSEFGEWIWDNFKADLLSARILELPRFVYSNAFRRTLKNLPDSELVAVQEELLKISNQLEYSDGDVEEIDVPPHFDYEPNVNDGTITFLQYTSP